MMNMLVLLTLFLLGSSLASFVNVMAGGSGDLEKNLKRTRSRCDKCRRDLVWWELVPVFSWLLLRGRCSKCGQRIGVFHPLSELILGIALSVGVMLSYSTGGLVLAILNGAYILVMYYFAVYDFFHKKVLNKYLYPVIGATVFVVIIQSLVTGDLTIIFSSVIGSIAAFLFFTCVNVLSTNGLFPGVKKGKEGFGWGDAKYGIFLGLILGWPMVAYAVWFGILSGAIFGIVIMVVKRKRNMQIPFVPFLSFGAWVAMSWGHVIMDVVMRYLTY